MGPTFGSESAPAAARINNPVPRKDNNGGVGLTHLLIKRKGDVSNGASEAAHVGYKSHSNAQIPHPWK